MKEMRVLLLSPYPDSLAETVRIAGDQVEITTEKITTEPHVDFLVSFGYRHILKPDVIASLGKRALNLHTSVLPWNKGAHPNYWSWVDGTPKGVTLHVIDAGIDTGPIIAQEMMVLDPSRSLEETYFDLRLAAEAMFARNWQFIRLGAYEAFNQIDFGKSHRQRDLPKDVSFSEPSGMIAGDVFSP